MANGTWVMATIVSTPSAISHQPSAISHQPLAISHAERHMRSLLERRLMTSCVLIAGVCLVTPGGGPSVEEVFVASAQAAEDTEGAMCMMPDGVDGPPEGGHYGSVNGPPEGGPHVRSYVASDFSRTAQSQLAIPKSSNTEGGDLPPVRMVVDPYPSFNGIVVDTTYDLVMMSDTNRKSLLVYDRTAGSLTSKEAATPRQQIMGPDTGVGFVAGVAMDPGHRELFTVNNDVEDRLVVFDYDDRGNVKPKRLLYVPHQSWGIAFAPKRDVLALSVQTPNMFVVFRREARKFDAPIRSVRGPKTQMADPHGIYFDETNNEIVVANNGDNSILVFPRTASGDVPPKRVIRGALTGVKGPMGVAIAKDEIYVANFGDHTALVFPRLAGGNVRPRRIIRNAPAGRETSGFGNPYAVAYDTKRQEILVPN